MRRFILISLAVTLVFMVTGCMHFKALTTGYCDPNSSVQLSPESQMFVIENQQAKNPFIEKEIKTKIVTLLKKKGYQISSFDTADFYLIYSYGIGPGQTVTGHHTQTYTSQKLNVFTGQFDTVPRTQTFTTRRTEHDRWLFIKVIDANEFRETRATHAIWVGETYSRGSTRDVRKIIDYLLIPTFEHFGEDTDKAVRHTMIQGDRRVKELNKATRKELDKFSSKKRVTREATVRPEPNYSARTQVTAGERVYPDCDLKIRELLTAGEDVALCINITQPNSTCPLSQDAIPNWQKAIIDVVGNFYENVVFSYYNKFENFTLVDRSNLLNVLKEHQLSQSGLTDNEKRIEVGKLVGINYLVNIGYNRYCVLPRVNDTTTIKMIEIETGKIVAVDTIENLQIYNPKSLQLEIIKTVLNGQEVVVGPDGKTLYRKQTQ